MEIFDWNLIITMWKIRVIWMENRVVRNTKLSNKGKRKAGSWIVNLGPFLLLYFTLLTKNWLYICTQHFELMICPTHLALSFLSCHFAACEIFLSTSSKNMKEKKKEKIKKNPTNYFSSFNANMQKPSKAMCLSKTRDHSYI